MKTRLVGFCCAAALLSATGGYASDFLNGAFETDLATGWTMTGTQADRVADGDADADTELHLYWNYQTGVIPYSGSPVDTSIRQDVMLDSTNYRLVLRMKTSESGAEVGSGTGSAFATVRVALLDSGAALLAETILPDAPSWQEVSIDLTDFAAAESVDPVDVDAVRLSASVQGVIPAKPGYVVGSAVYLDDVRLESTLLAVVGDWSLYN